MPNSNHGTFCAGIVGARQNNSHGGSGAAPECELMLVACLGDQVGTQTTLARAVSYAANPSLEVPGADPATGADILVSSLGPERCRLGSHRDAAAGAWSSPPRTGRNGRGLAIFWAASNGNNVDVMQDEVVSHADVIAVVRSTRMRPRGQRGARAAVELIAPGVDVVSTTGNGGYGTEHRHELRRALRSRLCRTCAVDEPRLTRDELRAIMRDSADKIGGVVYDANGHNDDYGFGRVNALRAVSLAEVSADTPTEQPTTIALVRQTPGWATIPVAFANGDGTWNVTNGAAPNFIPPGRTSPACGVVSGDFNGNGLTDLALVRQTPGWARSRSRSPTATAPGTSPTAARRISSRTGRTQPGVRVCRRRLQRQRADRHWRWCGRRRGLGHDPDRVRQRRRHLERHQRRGAELHPRLGARARRARDRGRLQRQRADRHRAGPADPGLGHDSGRVRQRRRHLEHHQRRGAELHRRLGARPRSAGRRRATSTATG